MKKISPKCGFSHIMQVCLCKMYTGMLHCSMFIKIRIKLPLCMLIDIPTKALVGPADISRNS